MTTVAERRRRLLEQSRAEVPGFDARTRIDDAIGKLIALRRRLAVSPELQPILDDLDEVTDHAVEVGLDPEADDVRLSDVAPDQARGGRYYETLRCTAAEVFDGSCSCGGVFLGSAVETDR